MDRYFSWVLRHRLAMLLLVGLLSALSVMSLSRAVIATSIGELFLGNSPEYQDYLAHVRTYGSDEIFVISYEESDPLSVEALDKLERIRAQIETDPEVHRTTSLLTLDRIQSLDGLLTVESYADAARANPEQRAALVAEIQADPLLNRTVIAASGTQAAMAIELTVDPSRSGEIGPQLVGDALSAFKAQGYTEEQLHQAGFPAVMTELLAQTRHSMLRLFPFVLLVMVGIVTVLFRSPVPVLLSMGVSLLSVLWTLGIAVAFKPTLNIFHGGVPAVVTVVAVSDVIHLWSAYLHELRDGRPRDRAILLSAVDVGRACLFTSMTTFVGFVSISLIPTPVFREFGWALGCGVAMALILAMTLVPIAASFGKPPSAKALQMDNPVAGVVDRLVSASAHLSRRFPWPIIVLFGLLMAGSIHTMSQIKIETNGIERLDEDNKVRTDADMFREEYTGTISLDVYLHSDTPQRMLDTDVLNSIGELERRIEDLPDVDKALSHVDLLRRIHRTLGGEGPLPDSRAAIAQELLLFEMGGGQALTPLLDFERQGAHLALQTSERRMRGLHELGEQVEQIGHEVLPEDISIDATGLIALSGGWLEDIVRGQKLGVLTSILGIAVLMMLGLRNVMAGLLSMIPNLLPLVVVTATCGLVWTDLDSDTLVILMMAIGIGVDDTIHFLTRLKTESSRAPSQEVAIARTFSFAGRAIVMTTVILALGFGPMAMSEYYSMAIMGTLLPLALVVAMMGDLLLVPAMAQVGLLRFKIGSQQEAA